VVTREPPFGYGAAVARFELTETVGQPPQVAWDYFVDPDNTPKWNSNVSDASIDGEPRVGGTITTKASFLGVKIESGVPSSKATRRVSDFHRIPVVSD
jgi:hypothetical protein